MAKLIKSKVLITGNIVEVFEYSTGYFTDYSDSTKGGRKPNFEKQNNESQTQNRETVLRRAKADLRRLINANHLQYPEVKNSKFVTLTFAEDIQDVEIANKEFRKFIKRLNYLVYQSKIQKLKYSCVIEFQKSGRIHYHIIFYNLPYIKSKDLSDCWGNGFIKINKIEDVTNVGAYISSYLGDPKKCQGRSTGDSRLQSKKSYFNSRGLKKPVEITDKKIVEQVATALLTEKIIYSAEFENEYLGKISYKQYNLNDL